MFMSAHHTLQINILYLSAHKMGGKGGNAKIPLSTVTVCFSILPLEHTYTRMYVYWLQLSY